MKNKEEQIKIRDDADVAEASSKALRLGEAAGFSSVKRHMISTAVSELGTNIYRYAQEGKITIRVLQRKIERGIEIVAEDKGPGIADIQAAMKDNFSTSGSLGVGLPGVKRMMDEFEINTTQGMGTKITARKWV